MLYLSFFCSVTLLLYSLFGLNYDKKKKLKSRISNVFDTDQPTSIEEIDTKDQTENLYKKLLKFIVEQLKRIFSRKLNDEKEVKLEYKLLRAGSPLGMTTVDFRLIQIAIFIIVPFISIGYGLVLQLRLGILILLGLFGIALASYLPHYYLNKKMKYRNKLALKELPDFLDLLTVSLEAGLGFDSAISKVVSKKDGVLNQEFRRCLEEIRLGKTRREAMSGIRNRLTLDEINSFIGSIIQAEKLGIGMVQVLRVQSSEVREQRKQRAEEEAMKAPIKMLFPLVLFIFPSLFIVLLGPAVINFIETLSKQ
ncbi:MAG: type secretion system family protein [Bacillales bacterium]|jgi:tight adherence protein C|nr:type secretion system family protein [Bacillales bacterium]